jgi:phage-related protein
MSRDISQDFREAIYAQETNEVFLVLITIDHADLDDPLRLVNNSVSVVSRGNTYYAAPIQVVLPTDAEGEVPRARLVVDNVDRTIVAAVRAISSAPTVTLEIVKGSDLDTVEAAYNDLQLKDVRYDSLVVEGELNQENFLTEPFPSGAFTPGFFPGLF